MSASRLLARRRRCRVRHFRLSRREEGMRRREFISLIVGAALHPVAARAQEVGPVYRIAWVATTSPLSELVGPVPVNPLARAFSEGVRENGCVEGNNLLVQWRTAEGKWNALPGVIRQLVADKVDVIVAPSNQVTDAVIAVANSVPIVMMGNTASGGPDKFVNRHSIIEFAARNHLPAMYVTREFVRAGGLMSYGANLPDLNWC